MVGGDQSAKDGYAKESVGALLSVPQSLKLCLNIIFWPALLAVIMTFSFGM